MRLPEDFEITLDNLVKTKLVREAWNGKKALSYRGIPLWTR